MSHFFISPQIQCVWDKGGDLTGTVVKSDKPVFITSGSRVSSVGTSGYDHIVSYIQPTEFNGNDYIVAPLKDMATGDLLRIIGEILDWKKI